MSKSFHQLRIEHFMRLAGQAVPDQPTELDEATRILRAKLILEEAFETIREGLGIDIIIMGGDDEGDTFDPLDFDLILKCTKPMNMVEFADGCADLSVVTIGSLSAAGITDGPLLEIVDQSNLSKFGPGSYRRDDGKWMKPPNFKPPDIAGILEQQRQ